ncbi:unnamed protein product [Fusarium graminearum]|nr:unnamed protein product [Fusarium graminearum]
MQDGKASKAYVLTPSVVPRSQLYNATLLSTVLSTAANAMGHNVAAMLAASKTRLPSCDSGCWWRETI